jgi:plasmid replication initiation protein
MYLQRQSHDIVQSRIPILAVIEESHTKSMLREVSPLMSTYLKPWAKQSSLEHY